MLLQKIIGAAASTGAQGKIYNERFRLKNNLIRGQ